MRRERGMKGSTWGQIGSAFWFVARGGLNIATGRLSVECAAISAQGANLVLQKLECSVKLERTEAKIRVEFYPEIPAK
jgi:hypothetical protein